MLTQFHHLQLNVAVQTAYCSLLRWLAHRFAHDAVRWQDKVYICSTGAGEILEFDYAGMKFVRVLRKVKQSSHVNTVAPDGKGGLWAVLHMKGEVSSQPASPSRVYDLGYRIKGLS